MSTTRLLIAAVVLAGLSGGIWWSNKQEAAKATAPDPKALAKILSYKEEDLSQIEIQRLGDPATVLTRAASGKWAITAPVALDVDSQAVSAITAGASSLSPKRVVLEQGYDAAAYGLEPPKVSVKFTLKDGTVKRMRLGEPTPDQDAAYVAVDGDPKLYTVDASNKATFDKRLPELRDKHLLKFVPDDLTRMELTVPGKPGVQFSRSSDERWKIEKPRAARADGLEVDALVARLKDAEMDTMSQDVLGNDKAAVTAFASGKPVATAQVTGRSVETLEVRQVGADYYARSSSVAGAFKVTPALGTGLNKTLADFQNKKLFDFGFDEPSKIEWKSKDNTVTFEKTGSNWQSNGRVMDSVAVQNVIDKLRGLAASRVDDVSAGAATIDLTVVAKATETVQLALAGSDYIGRRGGEMTLYRIDGGTIAGLRQAFTDVQEAPLPDKGKAKSTPKK